MRDEIFKLQTYRRQTERLFDHLASQSKVDQILNRLRNGDNLEVVSEWLEQSSSQNIEECQNLTHESSSRLDSIRGTLSMAEGIGSTIERNLSREGLSSGQSTQPFHFLLARSQSTLP